jgi:hypothetical protein
MHPLRSLSSAQLACICSPGAIDLSSWHTSPSSVRSKDFYEILHVPKGAGDAQIKRSYRKLALQYHPVGRELPRSFEHHKICKSLRRPLAVNPQDKVTGGEAEKKEAAKKFAEINNGEWGPSMRDPCAMQPWGRQEGMEGMHAAEFSGMRC